jgi:hypothetical protein
MRKGMALLLLMPLAAFGAALEKYGTSAYQPQETTQPAPKPTLTRIREEAQAAIEKFATLSADEKKSVRAQLELKRKEAEQAGNQEAWLYFKLVLDGIGGGK